MASGEKQRMLEELSDLAIAGLKKIVGDGRKLSRDALVEFLKDSPLVDTLLEKGAEDGPEKKQQPGELERLKVQKEKLVRQLDGLEEQHDQAEKVYKRIMLFFAEWLRTESGGALDEQITSVKEVLKLRSNPALVEEAFDKLKTAALHGDVSKKEKDEKKKSIVSRLMSKDSPADVEERYILQFRITYQHILNELGLDLGMDFLPKLLHLGKRINSSITVDDFTGLRSDILDLLHDYIETVSDDRYKAAEFIRDIGRKLMDVEIDLVKTLGVTDDVFSDNSRFGNSLINELSDLETSLGFSQKIDELKEVVNAKLALIKTAVLRKTESDRTMKDILDKDTVRLKAEFDVLKKEAATAREQAEQFEHEMFTDPLTGAMNRRAYDKRIKEEYDRYVRYQRVFSVVLFDVDHFKNVNDTYGHSAGDTCLKEIIKRIAPLLRESDTLARFGGEEFVIILPETNMAGAKEAGEKLRKAVEKIEFVHRDDMFRITISLGVTNVLESDKGPGDLFNRIDMAMYEAKKSGRNRLVARG